MGSPLKFENEVEIEEGEYGPLDDYDPAYEYPGEDPKPEVSKYTSCPRYPSPPPTVASTSSLNKTSTLRLIVLKSSILSQSKRVAVLDGYTEVSVGRDVASTARIRLKEMAVSKFHVSIYWNGAKHEWGIVDQGSMHGTFVRSGSTSPSQGTRLSPPRMASLPRVLKHMDEITIGGTTFRVHEHVNCRPCPECTIDDDKAEIPLFASSSSSSKPIIQPSTTQELRKRKLAVDENTRDPKKAMAKLKSSLMSRHPTEIQIPTSSYKDRSALRRELHPEPKIPASLIPPPPPLPSLIHHFAPPDLPQPPVPPPPISPCSIGHKLLLLQGWNPGTALGEDPTSGLLEPLEIQQRSHRAGLGAQPSSKSSSEMFKWTPTWQEEAKRRRWDNLEST